MAQTPLSSCAFVLPYQINQYSPHQNIPFCPTKHPDLEKKTSKVYPTKEEFTVKMIIQIKSEEEVNAILDKTPADKLVILNFYAAWAEPCTQMNQLFETIATDFPDAATYLSIDAEDESNASTAEKYDISAVPYFLFLKGETVLEQVSGANPALLKSLIEKHSGVGALNLPAKQSTTSSSFAANGAATEAGGEGEGIAEDINDRLRKLVSAAPVMLFMKGTPAQPQCGFSRQLVTLLREREVRYGFFNILADDEVRQGLKAFSDWPTYPQLYYQGELIGGLDLVKEEFDNDPDFLRPGIAIPTAD